MRKMLTIAAAAVATLTATVAVAAPAEQQFVYQGETYVYTTEAAADGRQVIAGRRLDDGQRFRLTVRNGRVSGTAGGVPVAFRLAEAKGAAGGIVATAN